MGTWKWWCGATLLLGACFGSNGGGVAVDDGGDGGTLAGSGSAAAGGAAAGSGAVGSADAPGASDAGVVAASGGTGGASASDPAGAGSGAPCVAGEVCTPPNPDDCEALVIETELAPIGEPGSVLFVYDRSSSMNDTWGATTRWEAMAGAVVAALAALDGELHVGSLFFPSSDPNAAPVCIDPTGITCLLMPGLTVSPGSCGVNPIRADDQIDVSPLASFLSALEPAGASPLYAPIPDGFTPLFEALQQADLALASASPQPTAVVVLTDGQPNCMWDALAAEELVGGWRDAGIATHVVGVPGVADTAPLESLAAAGGTTFSLVDQPAQLEDQLRGIVAQTLPAGLASCAIDLSLLPEPSLAELHLVVVESGVELEVPRDAGSGAGWSAGGGLAELTGALCDDALGGRFESIDFVLGCVALPTLPPY